MRRQAVCWARQTKPVAGLLAMVLLALTLPGCSLWRGMTGGGDARSTIRVQDVEGRKLKIGGGKVWVVTGATLRGLKAPKMEADLLPPRVLADPEVRLLHVLDLGGRVPSLFYKDLRKRIERLLDEERRGLAGEHARLGLQRDGRDAIAAVFDEDGESSRALGLNYGPQGTATIVFDPSGNIVRSWRAIPPREELVGVLGLVRSGQVTPEPGGMAARGPVAQRGARPELEAPGVAGPAPVPQAPVARPYAAAPGLSEARPGGEEASRRFAEAIAAGVQSGRLSQYASDSVSFVKANPVPRFGPPGALEDAALAATIRGALATVAPGVRPQVGSRMGIVELHGVPPDPRLAAAILEAAIEQPGALEVRAYFQ